MTDRAKGVRKAVCSVFVFVHSWRLMTSVAELMRTQTRWDACQSTRAMFQNTGRCADMRVVRSALLELNGAGQGY